MKTQTISLHFRVEGKLVTNMARQLYFWEDEERGIEMLRTVSGLSLQKIKKIINGESQLVGTSVCGKLDCFQCKDESTPLNYIAEKDTEWLETIKADFGDKVKIVVPEILKKYRNGEIYKRQDKKIIWIRKNVLNNYVQTWNREENTIKNMNLQFEYGRISKKQMLDRIEKFDRDKGTAHEKLLRELGITRDEYDDFGWVSFISRYGRQYEEDGKLVNRLRGKTDRNDKSTSWRTSLRVYMSSSWLAGSKEFEW